jgi:hypothetical protein
MNQRAAASILACALAMAALPAMAQSYTITKFKFPPNATVDGAIGLTRGGTVYGNFQDAQGNQWLFGGPIGGKPTLHNLGATGIVLSLAANDTGEFAGTLNYPTTGAFTLNGRKLRIYKPAAFSSLRGLDNEGDIVSLAVNAAGTHDYGLLRPQATHKVARYRVPASFDTWPVGTNNSFAVIGYYTTRADREDFQGFLYENGTTLAVAGPGQAFATPVAIDDAGTIAMISGGNSYLFDGANYTTLAVPGAVSTTVSGLNNAGGAFGTYVTADTITHGFVFKNGAYTTLDAPAGKEIARLLGMDDAGNVVGSSWKSPAYPATRFVASCTGSGC